MTEEKCIQKMLNCFMEKPEKDKSEGGSASGTAKKHKHKALKSQGRKGSNMTARQAYEYALALMDEIKEDGTADAQTTAGYAGESAAVDRHAAPRSGGGGRKDGDGGDHQPFGCADHIRRYRGAHTALRAGGQICAIGQGCGELQRIFDGIQTPKAHHTRHAK